jgi:hypothetical protein
MICLKGLEEWDTRCEGMDKSAIQTNEKEKLSGETERKIMPQRERATTLRIFHSFSCSSDEVDNDRDSVLAVVKEINADMATTEINIF